MRAREKWTRDEFGVQRGERVHSAVLGFVLGTAVLLFCLSLFCHRPTSMVQELTEV